MSSVGEISSSSATTAQQQQQQRCLNHLDTRHPPVCLPHRQSVVYMMINLRPLASGVFARCVRPCVVNLQSAQETDSSLSGLRRRPAARKHPANVLSNSISLRRGSHACCNQWRIHSGDNGGARPPHKKARKKYFGTLVRINPSTKKLCNSVRVVRLLCRIAISKLLMTF